MNQTTEATKTVDAQCHCERCISRTTTTYTLHATCVNCAERMTVRIRRGDRRPLLVECPTCGVNRMPVWGGIVEVADE